MNSPGSRLIGNSKIMAIKVYGLRLLVRFAALASLALISVMQVPYWNRPGMDESQFRNAAVYPMAILSHETVRSFIEVPDDADGATRICSSNRLQPLSLPSVNSLWLQDLEKIRAALLHSPLEKQPAGEERDAAMANFTNLVHQVAEMLLPSRLRRSVRPQSVSQHHHQESMRDILNIIWKRQQNATAPPLNVLVFGGSATAGSNCERIKNNPNKKGPCAWPGHLQEFANAYLGFDAIRVINFAMGGTGSDMAAMMIRFNQISKVLPNGPDIIINGHGINDFMRNDERLDPMDRNYQKNFVSFLESIQSRLRNCHGTRPLVIFVDDVVAQCRSKRYMIERTELFNSEFERLTKWYQVMAISYSDVVRDWMFADTDEAAVLVDWRGDCRHHTWGGHIAIVLSIAFNAMNSVIDFCGDLAYDQQATVTATANATDSSNNTMSADVTVNKTGAPLDSMFRPSVDTRLHVDDFAVEWRARQQSWRCDIERPTCAFTWVGLQDEGELGPQRDINQIIQYSKGWWVNLKKWRPSEYGIYGTKKGILLFNVTDPMAVNGIVIIYMKSYSQQWVNSTVHANVFLGSTDSSPVATATLSGYHTKLTSEYFTETLLFNVAPNQAQDSVLLHLNMTAGDTFKIMGIAFCNGVTKEG